MGNCKSSSSVAPHAAASDVRKCSDKLGLSLLAVYAAEEASIVPVRKAVDAGTFAAWTTTRDAGLARLPLSPRKRRRRSLASPRRHRICSRTTSTRTRTARPHVPWAPETLESRLNFATYPSKGLVACRARLAALATAMDALLKPVLGDLHDPESLASATVGASVADVLQQAQKALSITATAHAGLVSHLVALLPTLCDSAHRLLSCGRKLEPARRWECTVPSLQAFVNALAAAITNRITVEPPAAYALALRSLDAMLAQLGLGADTTAPAILSGTGRGVLLYLRALAAHKEAKLSFVVSRHGLLSQVMDTSSTYWDSAALPAGGTESRPSAVQPVKLQPQFTGEARRGVQAMEAGQGHGPRKEVFVLAAAALCGIRQHAPQEAPQAAPEAVSLLPEDSSTPEGAAHASAAGFQRTDGHAALSATLCQPVQPAGPAHAAAAFEWRQEAGVYTLSHQQARGPDAERRLRFAGWLLGQALMSRCAVGVQLSQGIFQHLAGCNATDGGANATGFPTLSPMHLGHLQGLDSGLAAGLERVQAMRPMELKDFLQLEQAPLGSTAASYIAAQLVTSQQALAWQLDALAAGFRCAVPVAELVRLDMTARDLQELICGPPAEKTDFKLSDIFHLVTDPLLQDTSPSGSAPLAQSLWRVVDAFHPELKVEFVAFVTASHFLPTPKTDVIRVELPFTPLTQAEGIAQLGMLPQAHTCDNVLEVPDYWQALLQSRHLKLAPAAGQERDALEAELDAIVGERIRYAIANCAGYDLDEDAM